MYLSAYLFVCHYPFLSISLSLFVYVSVFRFIFLFIYLCVFVRLSACLGGHRGQGGSGQPSVSRVFSSEAAAAASDVAVVVKGRVYVFIVDPPLLVWQRPFSTRPLPSPSHPLTLSPHLN